eukprot:2035605-Pyramimonas_sp.AAC.1
MSTTLCSDCGRSSAHPPADAADVPVPAEPPAADAQGAAAGSGAAGGGAGDRAGRAAGLPPAARSEASRSPNRKPLAEAQATKPGPKGDASRGEGSRLPAKKDG